MARQARPERRPSARRRVIVHPTVNVVLVDDSFIYTAGAAGGSCPAPTGKDMGNQFVKIHCSRSTSDTGRCRRPYFEWDIQNVNSNNITDIVFSYEVSSITSPRNCHIVKFATGFKPSANNAATVWNHINTQLQNSNNLLVANTDQFNTLGPKNFNLGPSAEADLSAKKVAGQTYWAFAIVYTDSTRDGVDHFTDIVSSNHMSSPNRPKCQVTFP